MKLKLIDDNKKETELEVKELDTTLNNVYLVEINIEDMPVDVVNRTMSYTYQALSKYLKNVVILPYRGKGNKISIRKVKLDK